MEMEIYINKRRELELSKAEVVAMHACSRYLSIRRYSEEKDTDEKDKCIMDRSYQKGSVKKYLHEN